MQGGTGGQPEEGVQDVPTFMGAASRKRKWELAAEKGIVPPIGFSSSGQVAAVPGSVGQAASVQNPGVGAGKGNGLEAGAPLNGEDGAGQSLPGTVPPVLPPTGVVEVTPGDAPGMRWLTLDAASSLVVNGLPNLAPAIWPDAALNNLLAEAQTVMADLGIEEEAITLSHDSEWTIFPEVGDAIKAAGGEMLCYCVAEHPAMSIWAVGVANHWKKREQAARLALCLAVASNITEFSSLFEAQPEFVSFCECAGIATNVNPPVFAPPGGLPEQELQALAAKGQGRAALQPAQAQAMWTTPVDVGALKEACEIREPALPPAVNSWRPSPTGDGHRDKPIWFNIATYPESGPGGMFIEGLPTEALALCTRGTGKLGVYGKADAFLNSLVTNVAGDISFHDDPNWEYFPSIGKLIQSLTGPQECQTVAICRAHRCWAVGVCMKGKNRFAAAKAAIAVAIAVKFTESGQDLDYKEYPALGDLVEEAVNARLQARAEGRA